MASDSSSGRLETDPLKHGQPANAMSSVCWQRFAFCASYDGPLSQSSDEGSHHACWYRLWGFAGARSQSGVDADHEQPSYPHTDGGLSPAPRPRASLTCSRGNHEFATECAESEQIWSSACTVAQARGQASVGPQRHCGLRPEPGTRGRGLCMVASAPPSRAPPSRGPQVNDAYDDDPRQVTRIRSAEDGSSISKTTWGAS